MSPSLLQSRHVKTLAGIQTMADSDENTTSTKSPLLSFPVNTLPAPGTGVTVGMVSYASFGGSCRKLNNPSLDLFYNACDKAQVDCRHVDMYVSQSP
jgi:hypothetical protein